MPMADVLKADHANWNQCKYDVHIEIKFSDGNVREVKPSQIEGLYIEKDYDNDHLPILILDLALSVLDENKIDNETEFNIRIKQFYVQGDSTDKREPKLWLNDTFVKLNYGVNPDTKDAINRKARSANGMSDDDVAPEDLTSQTSYPLVKKSDLILTKQLVNCPLSNVTQQDIFFWMMSKIGCRKPWLVSNFTNTEQWEEFLVQPKGFLENMLFLEKEFGWHTEGTCIFFDYDVLYVIRKSGTPTAWRVNEPKEICFCITEATDSDNVPSGIIKKNNIIYFNLGNDQYHRMNASTVADQVEGKNMLLVNTTNSGNSSNVQSQIKTYGNGAYSVKSYHGHNPYVNQQYSIRKLEQENTFQLVCLNADLSFLCPNKQVTVITNVTSAAKDFGGIYRLAGFKSSLIKDGDYFDSSTEVIIKKTS